VIVKHYTFTDNYIYQRRYRIEGPAL